MFYLPFTDGLWIFLHGCEPPVFLNILSVTFTLTHTRARLSVLTAVYNPAHQKQASKKVAVTVGYEENSTDYGLDVIFHSFYPVLQSGGGAEKHPTPTD